VNRIAAALLALLLTTAGAGAERLVLSLSSNFVAIGSNFTGAQLVVFGVVERDAQSVSRVGNYEAVVTVRGPREAITVRRKEPFGPIWLNRSQQKFVHVPSYLAVLASRPIRDIAADATRDRFRLGIDGILNAPEFTTDRGRDAQPFRAALARLKAREQLYIENERGVTFVTGEFLRAAIPLPATAPTGNYEVEATLLADGVVIARRDASFEVVKTGLEEHVTALAEERPLLSGLSAAAMALLFGWLATVIFRRD
jgi:uncharacterized protein (TIGR02186 family)